MDVAMGRAQKRRKAWRRLMRAGNAKVVEVSVFWLGLFMFASVVVGFGVGATILEGIVDSFYTCVRVP